MFDTIIVGAGFAGAVMAERLANERGQKVLIIEKRTHIAGNAYDRFDEKGVLIHQYGPHIFHTKLKHVWDYLSRFTEWRIYHHEVLGSIDGQLVPIPFNLNSLHALLPDELADSLERKLVNVFGYNTKVPILRLRESDDEELKWLAEFVYEKIFLHYTMKQWGVSPEELNPHVTGRVPVYVSRDNRYFQDRYQGMPKDGYTRLFERMLSHPNIKLMLNTDYKEILEVDPDSGLIRVFGQPFAGKVIFTGKIDEFFDYRLGELPYRSLRFQFETLDQASYQPTGTINYPNDYDFTRITEFNHLTGQRDSRYTTIVKEFPQPYERHTPGREVPYYPVPNPENGDLYAEYRRLARELDRVVFLGRLAEYTYYDMDAVVSKALKVFEERF
ncbi:UDP-galactopyranose mutase [Cohnella ginsengisoli]|uniref:UDP-galactopyranose mutase n=1 Tax=Cohnella ginsengisoli TaxID=425004 RepID=A0A9X4KQW1_9BACL|nr:UDP-galactopyranose mutase [Cohnella ginsengisoli]MDG0794582.1 UDP-galactopyranose mutase [Cohnella ginsengisoli]